MNIKNILNRPDGKNISLPPEQIIPNRFQPRKVFSEKEITSLAKSVCAFGILQPLAVRKTSVGYELVCGERRLKAAVLAGMKLVPCTVVELSDRQTALAALAENLQRQDLNFFEQAEGFKNLIETFGMTQQSAAIELGMSQPAVANKLRLLKIPQKQREYIISHNMTERHARALLKADPEHFPELLEAAFKNSLTAEAFEKYISEFYENEKKKRSYKRRSAAVGDVRLFFNTVEKAVSIMRLAGVNASTQKTSSDDFIEYVIRIPQKTKVKTKV